MKKDLTFDEWADTHDLDLAERRLCKDYLTFWRWREFARWMLRFAYAEEQPKRKDK